MCRERTIATRFISSDEFRLKPRLEDITFQVNASVASLPLLRGLLRILVLTFSTRVFPFPTMAIPTGRRHVEFGESNSKYSACTFQGLAPEPACLRSAVTVRCPQAPGPELYIFFQTSLPISELPFASVSKRVFMRNHSNEIELNLHENRFEGGTNFHMNGFARRLVLKQSKRVTWKWLIGFFEL